MRAIGICFKGTEEIAAKEIEEILQVKTRIHDTVVKFDADEQGLAKLCYKAQSLVKLITEIGNFTADRNLEKTDENIKKCINKTDFGFLKGETFKVKCKRIGSHDFSGQDIAPNTGEFILKKVSAKVSMTEPKYIIYVYIHETFGYIGIDYSGFDNSKRDYKVFTHSNTLNSSIAFSIFRIAGKEKGLVIDPFCGSGVIPIEAALYSIQKSPHFFIKNKFSFTRFLNIDPEKFDKEKKPKLNVGCSDHVLSFIKSTRNNAKLAGVSDILRPSKIDIEWLDTKFEKNSIDAIVTHPPSQSRQHSKNEIEKLYKEFFHQAEYVLKKDGVIVLCMNNEGPLKKCIENFKIKKKISVWQHKQELFVFIITKNINTKT